MKRVFSVVGVAAIVAGVWMMAARERIAAASQQPVLGRRTVPLLTVEGLSFKDLDHNDRLDAYEDWRLSAAKRADDLLGRLSLEEAAGLLVHGTLPSAGGPMASLGRGKGYDLDALRGTMETKHVNSFITRLSADAATFAQQNNEVQALGEASRWGIPVTISTDPRHHFSDVLGAAERDASFSLWPGPLGLAALNDPALTRRFADIVRQEYLAVGIRMSLAPQADLVTEPRWARADGTFGSNPQVASRMVEAYVAGIQNGATGLNSGSVIAVVKHWVGYGAEKNGWDGHNYYGRFATFASNDSFAQHLVPFEGAFRAHVAGVMPTYVILEGVTLKGKPLEPVGAGFSSQLLTDLLRKQKHFDGVVVSDWGITSDCSEPCRNGVAAGAQPTVREIGMPWGVETLTRVERFAKAINAGNDQIGGTEDSAIVVEAVRKGLLTEARVRESARRVLLQKFEQGLFEQPYVDDLKARAIAGNAEFVQQGREAQARATVLLKNDRAAAGALLPLKAGTKVFLVGVAPKQAEAVGFTVVADAAQADVAIVHAKSPYESEHKGYFFGSRQHEGRLSYKATDAAMVALSGLPKNLPVVFITTLERPLILTDVVPRTTAVLGEFGISDVALMAVLTGKEKPQGRLPFALPSSQQAVEGQRSDVANDSKSPLFAYGFGLSY